MRCPTGPWTPTGAEKRPGAGQGRKPFGRSTAIMTIKETKQMKIAACLVIIGVFANAVNRMPLPNVFIAFAYSVAIFLPIVMLFKHYRQKLDGLPKGLGYLGVGIGTVLWRVLRPYPTAETICAFMLGFLLIVLAYVYEDVKARTEGLLADASDNKTSS